MTIHRCFITGVVGFIGSHLAQHLLENGHEVVGVDNFDPLYDAAMKRRNLAALLTQAGFTFREADIRDAEAMRRLMAHTAPDRIYHLAALAGVRPSIQQPTRYASVNVDGLSILLDAARQTGCRQVIFASSSSVYGNNGTTPSAEDDRVDDPVSPYAATKAAGELICRTYAACYGFSIVAIRIFTVYGPGQRPDLAISKFMSRIARGETITVFGCGLTSRDYTYIDDVVRGVLAAGAKVSSYSQGFFRIYNLSGNEPIVLEDVISTIEQVVGKVASINTVGQQLGDVEHTRADLTRARAELGYEPQIRFVDGVERQWTWMQARP